MLIRWDFFFLDKPQPPNLSDSWIYTPFCLSFGFKLAVFGSMYL